MGYLSKCDSCNNACHSDARFCPSCGKPNPVSVVITQDAAQIGFTAFVVVIVFVVIVFYKMGIFSN
jgi:hypothetical protein